MSCGCRITQHLKEFELSTISSSSKFNVSSLIKPKNSHTNFPWQSTSITARRKILLTVANKFSYSFVGNSSSSLSPFINCIHSKSAQQLPIVSDSSFSQEDDLEDSSDSLQSITGGIVALGKFDALHVGHRELAIQASKVGTPFLLSFVGIAEVLGWAPRAPIVAKCDRRRVLSSWTPFCGNVTPKEFMVNFARVRHLSPRQFVEKLSKLGVHGVVAGENYRFGYKAAGDASELVRLCDEYGIQAYIINSVMDKNRNTDELYPPDKKDVGQVSSTRVRYALSKGDMNYVSELLGREHRLYLSAENKDISGSKVRFSAPLSCLLNLPPKEGSYETCSLILGDDIQLPCRVLIDSTQILLELDERDRCVDDAVRDLQLLGIEFKVYS